MRRREYYKPKGKLKSVVGIGGINCYCCTHGPRHTTKCMWNRISRRMLLRELMRELRSEVLDA
jgi:hypothetical protein